MCIVGCRLVPNISSVYEAMFSATVSFKHTASILLLPCFLLSAIAPIFPLLLCFFFSPGDAPGRAGLQPASHASVHLRPQVPGYGSAGDHPREEPGHPAPEAHQQVTHLECLPFLFWESYSTSKANTVCLCHSTWPIVLCLQDSGKQSCRFGKEAKDVGGFRTVESSRWVLRPGVKSFTKKSQRSPEITPPWFNLTLNTRLLDFTIGKQTTGNTFEYIFPY